MAVADDALDIERIAESIHANYLDREVEAGHAVGSAAALVGWEDLPEEYRAASRAQAQDILEKLSLIGAGAERSADSFEESDCAFTRAELDLLARREHERWMADKLSRGWTFGPRDDAARTHPCLIPYDELPEVERRKDEAVVLEIPNLLRAAGYRIVRDQRGARR